MGCDAVQRECVKISMARLTGRLSRESGRVVELDEAIHWLACAGFRRDGDDWYSGREPTKLLRAGEIVERRTLHTDDGITFVKG